MTEWIGARIAAISAVIGAILLATGINAVAIYAMEIIARPATNAATSAVINAIREVTGATYVPTAATSGMTAEIFETVSGKEFDRSSFEEQAIGGSNHCRRLCRPILRRTPQVFFRDLCALCG
jgi:hypothetical protein